MCRGIASQSSGFKIAHDHVFNDVLNSFSQKRTDTPEVDIFGFLRSRYPSFTVTMVHETADLLGFAKAGEATAHLDIKDQNLVSWLKYKPAKEDSRAHEPGQFKDIVQFAKYDYQWKGESFIMYMYCKYCHQDPPEDITYFILRERDSNDAIDERPPKVMELIAAASSYSNEVHTGDVLIWDNDSWNKSTKLWKSVQNSTWDKVILDTSLKENLIQDVEGFFDQKATYDQFEVPWKRGILMHGLPGNGKTITLRALMNGLSTRPDPVPTLYVKSGKGDYGTTYAIRHIFKKAREMTPCLLIFEDIDSLITDDSRSFFLNEVDGMESNDGIMMIGSTNYLEKLDAGITKRPSRFDRKYHFDLPAHPERTRYCDFWRSRLADNKAIEFPAKMSSAIAGITDGFSFAYLQELFISSLLVLVNQQRKPSDGSMNGRADTDPHNLESVLLWRVVCKHVEILRNEIKDSRKSAKDAAEYSGPKQAVKAGFS